MNYIKRLQSDNAAMARELAALRDGLADLYGYVSSSKFAVDTHVNTADITLRIREIETLATYAAEAAAVDNIDAAEVAEMVADGVAR